MLLTRVRVLAPGSSLPAGVDLLPLLLQPAVAVKATGQPPTRVRQFLLLLPLLPLLLLPLPPAPPLPLLLPLLLLPLLPLQHQMLLPLRLLPDRQLPGRQVPWQAKVPCQELAAADGRAVGEGGRGQA